MKKIQLTKGKTALIDDIEYSSIAKHKWHTQKALSNKYYAVAKINGKKVSMHRFLMDPPNDKEVDHINGNGLDNRRINLRIVTHSGNMQNKKMYKNNRTGYKGVYFEAKRNKFRAQIVVNGKKIRLGDFSDCLKASEAYVDAAVRYFGFYST